MAIEEIREAAKVMEAYASGKKIQYLDGYNKWVDATNPSFNWSDYIFRIKPEPKYRPFRSQEECWEEMHKHPDFGWIVYDKIRHSICDVTPDEITILYEGDSLGIDFKTGLERVTFTDGTQFGIKEE